MKEIFQKTIYDKNVGIIYKNEKAYKLDIMQQLFLNILLDKKPHKYEEFTKVIYHKEKPTKIDKKYLMVFKYNLVTEYHIDIRGVAQYGYILIENIEVI